MNIEANDVDSSVKAAMERRLDILRLRWEARERARRDLHAIEVDLAAIGDVIRWIDEHCATAGLESARLDLAARLAGSRSSAEMIRELCALRAEMTVDTAAFDVRSPLPSAETRRTRVGITTDDSTYDRTADTVSPDPVVAASLQRI